MGTLKPNIISLMTEEQYNSVIPEKLKNTAWKRTIVDGKLVLTPQTWNQMSNSVKFIEWYGQVVKIQDCTYDSTPIGTRYVVNGTLSMDNPEVFGLNDAKLDYVITPKQLTKFTK